MPVSATPLLRPLNWKKKLFLYAKMSTFLWQIQEIPSVFSLFSLFSVDSGDQKIKTFYTFFGFSAFRPQIWGNLHHLELGHNYWTTKNNHGREAAAFLKGRLLELGNNWELQITTTTGAKRPPFWRLQITATTGAKRPSFCWQHIATTTGAKRPPFWRQIIINGSLLDNWEPQLGPRPPF